MKLIAICGSARKSGNTATMLRQVLNGAASAGAQAEFVNLFDLDYKGCTGCCACKRKDSKFLAHCVVNDGLKPLLRSIEEADAIALGSPIYYGNLSGQMRAFTDRLLFQYLDYGGTATGPRPKDFRTALIATMNVKDDIYVQRGYRDTLVTFANIMGNTLGSCELLALTNTVMLDNYDKYIYQMPDKEEKASRKERISADDLQRAFDLGAKLVTV